MGNVIKVVDMTDYMEMMEETRRYCEEEEHQMQTLSESGSFSLVYAAKKFDDFLIDPFLGLFLPAAGDVLCSLATFPALYVAIFKLRSFKLTIAILFTMAVDLMCGLLPVAGDIVDVFYKSNKIACRYIVGYVEKDPATLEEINKKATWGIVWLVILGLVIYWLFSLFASLLHTISGWFAS